MFKRSLEVLDLLFLKRDCVLERDNRIFELPYFG